MTAAPSGARPPACSSTSTASFPRIPARHQPAEVLERVQVRVDQAHEALVDQRLDARRGERAQLRLGDAHHAGELDLRRVLYLHRKALEQLQLGERRAELRGTFEIVLEARQ